MYMLKTFILFVQHNL